MNNLDEIQQSCLSISLFIKRWLSNKETFGSRSFYGETFSLALLQREGQLDNATKYKLLAAYDKIDKTDSQFHWEFNNYAIFDYINKSNDISLKKYLEPLTFKNTPCTNWTLLRCNTKIRARIDYEEAVVEAKKKIKNFQLKSGLILDDPGVKSFQYHCFSVAMIAEIYELTNDILFYDSFIQGLRFIRHFILKNGETLYIGRGQNQSFGYGVLIYILSLGLKYTKDNSILFDIFKVFNFLSKFQRNDGSFPLVMNNVENSIPKVVDMKDPNFVGWYPYNNYFDYLPFMGFYISKSLTILKNIDLQTAKQISGKKYRDNNFIKIVTSNYEAVLSKPGGYWTNDLSIPYIVSGEKNLTPCYGGEQFQDSLYNESSLPLPFFLRFNKSIRWHSRSFYIMNSLWMISPFGIMKRKYIFGLKEIHIITSVFSLFKFKHTYLFDKTYICDDLDHMNKEGYGYSSSGKLYKYSEQIRKSTVTIKTCM